MKSTLKNIVFEILPPFPVLTIFKKEQNDLLCIFFNFSNSYL